MNGASRFLAPARLGVGLRKFSVAGHKKIGAQGFSLDYIGRHEDIQALQSGSTLSIASRAAFQ
jgi:hypothetical protein